MSEIKHMELAHKTDEFMLIKNPQALAIELMTGKNIWLTKIRWLYTIFIFVFFLSYNYLSGDVSQYALNLSLIIGLSALVNIMFTLALRRARKYPSEEKDYEIYTTMVVLQLDFDLLLLSLLVYFSGGFDSPIRVLFVFYVVIATFLSHHRKAFRNTVTATVLVTVIYFTEKGLNLSPEKIAALVAFNIILLFAFLISAYLSKNLRDNEEKINDLLHRTKELSVTDGLTGLYNQAHFFLLLKLQLEKAKRYKTQFSLIIFDVDNFKNYNDNNGHLKGSAALKLVGTLMRKVFRASDILAKYGGDEFVIILPNSDKVGAFLAADRMRETVEEENFDGQEMQPMGNVTLSLGIATYPEHAETVEELLDCADKALYAAKEGGRNKSVIYNAEMNDIH